MASAPCPGSQDLGPSSTRYIRGNLEHTTSKSLVLFMNKMEIINHPGPSHQVYVRILQNIDSSEISKASSYHPNQPKVSRSHHALSVTSSLFVESDESHNAPEFPCAR